MTGQGFFGGREGIGYYTDGEADVIVTTPTVVVVADTVVATYCDIAVHIVTSVAIAVVSGTGLSAPAPTPQGSAPYSSGLDVILTSPDGAATHIGANCEKLTTQRARKYGFESCTFELPDHLVSSWYHELQMMTDIQVVRNGITCFHGRITDPGLTVGTADHRRKITARGYFDSFSDDETVRACFADSDPTNWSRPVKVPKHDFGVDAGTAVTTDDNGHTIDGLVALAKYGTTYSASKYLGNDVGAWGDVCWKLYGGVPTTHEIAGIECHAKWNGLLDESLIVTSMLPRYNLFADPRGMSGSNPWKRTKDNPVYGFGDLETGAAVEKASTGYFHYDVGDNPSEYVVCGEYNAFTFIAPGGAGPFLGSPVWGHKMALPADMKKALADGQTVPISVGMYIAAYNQAVGSEFDDAGVLFVYDGAGNLLQTLTIFDGLDSYDGVGSWYYYSATLDALDPAAAYLELYITWQNNGSDYMIYRYLALPCVSNTTDPDNVEGSMFYADGDTPGWQWSSAANSSPSREQDYIVTYRALGEVYVFDHTGPLWATLFAADDPDAAPKNGVPATNDQLAIWRNYKQSDEHLSFTCGRRGIGLSAAIVGCPWTLQFKQPDTGYGNPPYGLVINDFTIYADAGMGDNGIGVTDCVKAVLTAMGVPAAQQVVSGSSISARQLVFNSATTWAAVLQGLDALLDWEYGFRENGVFYYLDPADFRNDPRHVYQIPYAQSEADLAVQLDDICNGCEVEWTDADGVPHSVLYTQDSPFLPANPDGSRVQKYHHVDFTKAVWMKNGATSDDAMALAVAYVADHIAPQTVGTMNLSVSTVLDGNGTPHDALGIVEGEYVRLVDAPVEEQGYGLLLVTRAIVDHDQLQVKLELGMNRKKLDAMLARLNARVVRR